MPEVHRIGGIWTPDAVAERYGPELAFTAGSLLHAYTYLQGGEGTDLFVPVPEMLALMSLKDTAECRAKLKQLVNRIGHKTGVGTRVAHNVVSVWFNDEIEALIRTYQRPPGGVSS